MDWKLYNENKKHKEEKEQYRTICRILAGIIVIIILLWWRSDNGRLKWVHELQDQIAEYEDQIYELKEEIEGLKEEYGQ